MSLRICARPSGSRAPTSHQSKIRDDEACDGFDHGNGAWGEHRVVTTPDDEILLLATREIERSLCTWDALLGGFSVSRAMTGAPVANPPRAPSGVRPRMEGDSGSPSQDELCSEPRACPAAMPCPNSRALAPGIAMRAWARAGSMPENHGAPNPIGSPSILTSTLDPMLSRSLRTSSMRSIIRRLAFGSLQRISS